MTRSTGLSPNGTEPCEVVPRATSFFHQVRFSPTSIPNQRTLPFSTLVSAPSVQDVLDPFHQVGVTLQERPRAQSADLLVGIADIHQVAVQTDSCPLERDEGHELDDAVSLHVQRAPAPDVAVADLAAEGIHHPVLRRGGDHVHVVHQRDPASARSPGSRA